MTIAPMPRWAALVVAACVAAAAPALAYTPPSPQVAWVPAAADADVERAFGRARAEGKPLLLYWGAQWCPPCNRLKATLFNRQDFAERARSFVAVHVDGDLPGAQKLGARFKVRGYPTLVLFRPDGSEITRLPGEVEPSQVMAVLQFGLGGGRPVSAVLADAKAGRALTPNEWRLLAWHAWHADDSLVPAMERPALLAALARAAPEPEVATRLWLKALADSDEGKGIRPDAALQRRVLAVLGDAARARTHMDVLVHAAPELVRALAGGPQAERARWVAGFDAGLRRLQADSTLSRADRASVLLARVEVARLEHEEPMPGSASAVSLPDALLGEVRRHVERDDREIRDGHERQAVITTHAHLLGRAGLWEASDELLERNLARSHSPYYLMSQLAGNAKRRGDAARALHWYEQAYARSEGPATRLQWGASYVSALVELAPQDEARIEKAAAQVIADATRDEAAFHERSAASMKRLASRLAAWNAGGAHAAVLRRLQEQLDGVCARLAPDDAQRASCQTLLRKGG